MADDREPHRPAFLSSLTSGEVDEGWRLFLDCYASVVLQVARVVTNSDDDAADAFLFSCEKLRADKCGRLRRYDPGGAASFPTWLRAVCRNLCIDWYRSRYGRRRPFGFLDGLSLLHRETYRLVFQERLSVDEAVLSLRLQIPTIRHEDVSAAREDIWRHLHAGQRRELTASRGMPAASLEDVAEPEDAGPDPEERAAFQQMRTRLVREMRGLPARDRLLLRLRFEQELTLSAIAALTGEKSPQAVDRWIREVVSRLRRRMS